MTKKRCVFFDRDGTLNEDIGYPAHFSQIHIYPGSYEAVCRINDSGLAAVVITHQAGIARGYFTEPDLLTLHREFEADFKKRGARFDGILYCPHDISPADEGSAKDCLCRKPLPGLAHRAADTFDLDLEGCYMIGDKVDDILFGQNVGAVPVLVLTGYGRESLVKIESRKLGPAHAAPTVLKAVDWILTREDAR
jgi:D-glycero-D-manno-heptose 1,7-bisphosphate phosphatase